MRHARALLFCSFSLTALACANAGPGSATEAIVGGTLGGDPAVVWVYNGDEGGLCTGTLIAPRVVLTAKHCVQPPDWDHPSGPTAMTVGLGDVAGRGRTYRVQTVYTTPGIWHDDRTLSGELVGRDVALLVLSTGVSDVTPIPVRMTPPTDLPGQDFTAIGFGQIPSGRAGTKYTVMSRVASIDRGGDLIYVGVVTCQGDSGGPMVTRDREVAGVVSFGNGSCGTGSYGAYNAVYNYLDMIGMAIEEGGGCLNDGPEICDGSDNDCNGEVDETCTPIGGACVNDDECVATTCRDTAGGRLCTLPCDARRPDFGCDEGFYCARDGVGACEGWCVPMAGAGDLAEGTSCTSDDECASLYCADPGDGRRRCLQSCATASGMCFAGDVCLALTGSCGGCISAGLVSGLVHNLGEPCASDAECADGTCLLDGTAHYCSRSCGMGMASCPSGYHCRGGSCTRGTLGGTGDACITNEDCGSGAPICAARGPQHWCTNLCTPTAAMPCPESFDCIPAGEFTVCAPTGGLVGDACDAGDDCISGRCSGMGGADSVCVVECGVGSPCGTGFECRLAADGTPLCVRPRVATGGGCAVSASSGRRGGLSGILVVMAAVALGLRRRRLR